MNGYNNTKEVLSYIHSKYNIFEAEELILGGINNGEIAALQWSDYIAEKMRAKNVISIMLTDYDKNLNLFNETQQ